MPRWCKASRYAPSSWPTRPKAPRPGKTAWLGLQLTHAPEWHTYWKNSGDSGLPTDLKWTLPPGVSAGPIAWPTPRKFPIGTLANYGYNGTVLLPVPLTVDPSFQGKDIEVKLDAAWLVCRKECIPEEGSFTLSLPVEGSTAINGIAFETTFAAAPSDQAAGSSAAQPQAKQLDVQLAGLPAAWRGKALEFFPEPTGLIEPGSPWTQKWDGERWTASVPLSPYRSESPTSLPLVVALANAPGEGPGSAGVRLEVPVQGAWPAVAEVPALVPDALTAALQANAAQAATLPATSSGPPISLWAALLGALIGGMILNLMPCVFPVLAIKVLAFAKHADDRTAHRASGLAYTAGVMLSFLALGGLLLGLRAAGEQLGWGFQLQSPAVVASLAVLFTLIGLNLAGLFEFGSVLPSSVATLQAKNPTADCVSDRRARHRHRIALHRPLHGRLAGPGDWPAHLASAGRVRRLGPGHGPALPRSELVACHCARAAAPRRLDEHLPPTDGLPHVRHRGVAAVGARPTKRHRWRRGLADAAGGDGAAGSGPWPCPPAKGAQRWRACPWPAWLG